MLDQGPGSRHDGDDSSVFFERSLPEAVDRVAIRETVAKWEADDPTRCARGSSSPHQLTREAWIAEPDGQRVEHGPVAPLHAHEYAPFRSGAHLFTAAVIVESNEYTQPQIAAAIELLKRRLGPAEVASPHLFERCIGRNPIHLKPTYVIATIADMSGDLVAMASGSVTPTGLLLVGYTVSDEKYKGCRLGTKAYEALVVAAEEISKAQFGRSLRLLALEASHGAEEYWRRQGFGEIHLTDDLGLSKKLVYLQPPLNWIRESGEPESPEQFPDRKEIVLEGRRMEFPGVNEELMLKMVDTTGSEKISTEMVLEAIKAFYREYYFTKRAVDSSVHERYFGYFYALMDSYYHDLTSAREISLG